MRAILLTLALAGCWSSPRGSAFRRPEPPRKLSVPAAPRGESECAVQGEIKKLDQGLQSESPIPAALSWGGKAYTVAWARTEAVEAPEEEGPGEEGRPAARPPEMGPLQTVQVAPGAKKATGLKRLTNERTGPQEIELTYTGANLAYIFEDERGVHLLQRTPAGKPAGESLVVRGAHEPSITYAGKAGGLWASWAERCGADGQIKLLKIPAKEATTDGALSLDAPGLLCSEARVSLASSGNRLALSWLTQGAPDKRGNPGPVSLRIAFASPETGAIEEPITLKLGPELGTPRGGPVLAFHKEKRKEGGKTVEVEALALAWQVAEGAIGFAVIDPLGPVVVSPRLVPGSAAAAALAPSLSYDGGHYALSWQTAAGIWLGLLTPSGEMPTAPLLLGAGERASLAVGPKRNSYGFALWRPEESLLSSKALFFGSATCFDPKKAKKKTP